MNLRSVALRAPAVVLAAFWAVPFFGLIDLLVPFDEDDRQTFAVQLMLETGWGVFFTFLVAVPLVVWSIRPRLVVAAELAVAAVCLAVAAVATRVPGVLLPAAGLLVSAAIISLATRRGGSSTGPGASAPRRTSRPMLAVALVGAAPASWVAVGLVRSFPDPLDDVTNDLPHLPVQAALALAIPAVAVLASLRMPGWQLAAWTASVSALWWGALSLWYPAHLGSLGSAGGILAIAWATLLTVAVLPASRGSRDPVP